MENLLVNGIIDIEGMKFHDIEGGFGKDKKAMLIKDIAEIHGREFKHINEAVNKKIKRFKNNINVIDLKSVDLIDRDFLNKLGFSNSSIANSNSPYILSERGYAKLLKILEDDVAWEQYEKLVEGYFNMRSKEAKPTCIEDVLISSLQEMNASKGEVQAIKVESEKHKEELQGIREVITLNPNSWRIEVTNMLNKIAVDRGGTQEVYRNIKNESYKLLDARAGAKLSIRPTNMRRKILEKQAVKVKLIKYQK
ncbi:ORF6N domain-containing protein [Clostridium saccharoperbutylacetonicum]